MRFFKSHLAALLLASIVIVSLAMYLKTMAPTVYWGDAAEFQRLSLSLEIAHPPGYPSYILLGRVWTALLPIGSVAWKMNLLSALLAALTVGAVSLLTWRLSARLTASVFAGLVLATAPATRMT